jgi:type IV secretory pathway protease TraF
MNNKRRLVRAAIGLVAALCLFAPIASAYAIGYRLSINVSDSFPNKLYLSKKISQAALSDNDNKGKLSLDKGTLILFRHSLPNTPYEKRLTNIDLLKTVACVEGDYLERINDGFYCDGKEIAIVQPFDSQGEPYAVSFNYNGVIPKNELFVTAPHPYSLDSRHFGLIGKSQITGVVKCVIY